MGIPGVPRSPLNPPNLLAVALGVAQIGVFAAVAPVVRDVLRGPLRGATWLPALAVVVFPVGLVWNVAAPTRRGEPGAVGSTM